MIKGSGFTMKDDRVEIKSDGIYIDGRRTNIAQYRWIDDPLSVALAIVAMGIAGIKVGYAIAKSVKG